MGVPGFDSLAVQIDTVSPTACRLCYVSPSWVEAVLARCLAAEMSPATCLHTDDIRDNIIMKIIF